MLDISVGLKPSALAALITANPGAINSATPKLKFETNINQMLEIVVEITVHNMAFDTGLMIPSFLLANGVGKQRLACCFYVVISFWCSPPTP